MTATREPTFLDRLLDPISDCLTLEMAERLITLRADPDVQDRLDELAERNAEGHITPDERTEYEALVNAGMVVAILQSKARSRLANRT